MIEHFIPESQTIEIRDGKLHFLTKEDFGAPTAEEILDFEAKGLRLDSEGRPLHPEILRVIGEHGLRLGRSGFWRQWGPGYTGDPILMTPYRHNEPDRILLIERKDNGRLAFPGGFTDPEDHSGWTTAFRELEEESGIGSDKQNHRFFNTEILYRGPVRDDRETVHAWPETTAVYIETVKEHIPHAGDDAAKADWYTVSELDLDELHGSHGWLIKKALSHRKDRAQYR